MTQIMRGSISQVVNQSSTITTEQGKVDSERMVLHAPVMHLYVVLDGERPHDGASRYTLDGVVEVTIGRGECPAGARGEDGSTLAVHVLDGKVSREHARLFLRDGTWIAQDLGSKNGTWVNGRRVDGSTPVPRGALIEFGNTFLTLRPSVAPPLADAVSVRSDSKPRGLATVIPELVDAFDRLSTFARTNSGQVSILGETGVGKDLLARAYHDQTRRSGAFVAVNCGALPVGLVEAVLFGHKKGAYSGASTDGLGLVREAEGGTLFLDEIGDLPLADQTKLLRVIEAREVTPVGSSKAVRVDVRIVCATHRDIPSMVAQGSFREDLWARLNGFVIRLPPLRERVEDVGLLLSASLLHHAPDRAPRMQLSAAASRAILMRRWTQNIRELANAVGQAMSFVKGDLIDIADIPPDQAPPVAARTEREVVVGAAASTDPDLDQHSRQLRGKLELLLQEHHGNVSEIARVLGKARPQVHDWLNKLGLDAKKYRRRISSFE
jgi:DNA-binding NtrC family response regulator